jgi:NAD/NADP transhydrogenase alpha subunit
MVCCFIGALLAGNLAMAGRLCMAAVRRPSALVSIALGVAGASFIAIAPALAEHGRHYAARAEANNRSLVEEILAQPLCSDREAMR